MFKKIVFKNNMILICCFYIAAAHAALPQPWQQNVQQHTSIPNPWADNTYTTVNTDKKILESTRVLSPQDQGTTPNATPHYLPDTQTPTEIKETTASGTATAASEWPPALKRLSKDFQSARKTAKLSEPPQLEDIPNATDVLEQGAAPKPLSLSEAILLSLRYNPNVQSEQVQRVADKFDLRVAENDFEWQYSLKGSAQATATRSNGESTSTHSTSLTPAASLNGIYGTTYDVAMQNATDTSGHWNPGLELKIEQPLLRGFGKEVTLASLYNAQDQEVISRLRLKSTVIQTVVTVIEDYRQLIFDQNNLQTSKLSLTGYADTIKLDHAMIKAGRKAPTEVLQAEAQYASEQVTFQNTENSVINDKLSLVNTIGLPSETNFEVPNDVDNIELIFPKVEESYQLALQNNIQYLTDILTLRQDERNLVVAKDNAQTQLNLSLDATTGNGMGGGRNQGLSSLSNNQNTSVMVGLDLDVPIDDYTLRQAIIQAQVAVDTDKINLARDKRELRTTIINDISNIESQAKQVLLSKHALELQQKNQEYLMAKLKFGLVSTFQVTTKQQDLDTARQTLIQAKIDYLNNLTRLYADMGTTLDIWAIKVRY